MKVLILKSFILFAAITVPFLVFAQPPDPSDAMVPIDGGLSLLLAAAVSYGSKKMYDARKK